MKVALLLLLLAGLAYSQFVSHFGGRSNRFFGNQQRRLTFRNNNDDQDGKYHFSWVESRGKIFTGEQARQYCQNLGPGWAGVSIGSANENRYVQGLFKRFRDLPYFWTGGFKSKGGFVWQSGEPFGYSDWSHTGGKSSRRRGNVPQPDNREGNEDCVAVLDNVYRDGVKWHDVGCGHQKPVLCERN